MKIRGSWGWGGVGVLILFNALFVKLHWGEQLDALADVGVGPFSFSFPSLPLYLCPIAFHPLQFFSSPLPIAVPSCRSSFSIPSPPLISCSYRVSWERCELPNLGSSHGRPQDLFSKGGQMVSRGPKGRGVVGFLGRGLRAPLHQLRSLGSAVSSLSGVRGASPLPTN